MYFRQNKLASCSATPALIVEGGDCKIVSRYVTTDRNPGDVSSDTSSYFLIQLYYAGLCEVRLPTLDGRNTYITMTSCKANVAQGLIGLPLSSSFVSMIPVSYQII